MAARLRHGGVKGGSLRVSRCRRLPPGPPARASDVLLVADMSVRSNRQRRFRAFVADSEHSELEVEAVQKEEPTARTRTWAFGPPPRASSDAVKPATPHDGLNDELDAWYGRSSGGRATGSGTTREAEASRPSPQRVMMKLKRRGGIRGNPNRPSQRKKYS